MSNNNDDIDFDELNNINFGSLEDEDKKENFIKKRKPILKGTDEEKTYRVGLKFTEKKKRKFLKFKKSLGATTNNGIFYALIELGLEQHKKDLQKILKKDK